MLIRARNRAGEQRVPLKFAACDMLQLCIPDGSVDVVTIGYGFEKYGRCFSCPTRGCKGAQARGCCCRS